MLRVRKAKSSKANESRHDKDTAWLCRQKGKGLRIHILYKRDITSLHPVSKENAPMLTRPES